MKDNLFEILLNLFEKSLTQLQKSHQSNEGDLLQQLDVDEEDILNSDHALHLKSAQNHSTRVFNHEERVKLTRASYQFLMRMKQWCLIDAEDFELIMDQLQCSESRIVTLQETKWTIRNLLASSLDEKQLSFLDLVLYQTKDEQTLH